MPCVRERSPWPLSTGSTFYFRRGLGYQLTAGSFARAQGVLYAAFRVRGELLAPERIVFNPTNDTNAVSYFPLGGGKPVACNGIDSAKLLVFGMGNANTAMEWRVAARAFNDPLARGFAFDDPDASAYVESWLAAGFVGVGELIVHGHGADYGDVDSLVAIFKVAAAHAAPVLVHWEIGNVDPGATPASDNFDQLLAVLDRFNNVPIDEATDLDPEFPLKLILAHCGAGPGAGDLAGDALATLEERLDHLLANYPNVYFDIAGMLHLAADLGVYEVSPPTLVLTELGELVLQKMKLYPSRFLVGFDAENRTAGSTDLYLVSIDAYRLFLADGGTLSADEQTLVAAGNAIQVLYAAPRVVSSTSWSGATTHTSIPYSGLPSFPFGP